MKFKNIESWLRLYKTLLPNEYENFGRYIRQDPQLPDEFYYLLSSLSEPDSFEDLFCCKVNEHKIVAPVFHQLFNFYRSNVNELKYFSIELLPKIIDTYLLLFYTQPQNLPACLGAFLLGIYNLNATGTESRIRSNIVSLKKPSIYHDPTPTTNTLSKQSPYNTSNLNNSANKINTEKMPMKKFESITSHNRCEILAYVLGVYNWHIVLMSEESKKALCRLCSRISRHGFEKNLDSAYRPNQDSKHNSNNDKGYNTHNNNNNNDSSEVIKENNIEEKTSPNHVEKKEKKGVLKSIAKFATKQKSEVQSSVSSSSYYSIVSCKTSQPEDVLLSCNQSKSEMNCPSLLNDRRKVKPSVNFSLPSINDEDIVENIRLPFMTPLILEILKGIYFLIFNGLSYLSIQSVEDCHIRALYEMNAQVLLVTNAILNSVKKMSHSVVSSKDKQQHFIPLSPSLSLPSEISISKDAITSSSFKTKKLPEDIEVQENNPPSYYQLDQTMINTSLSTSENLDISANQEAFSDSEKNPFSRIPIISMIKSKDKNVKNLQQRNKEETKDTVKETPKDFGGEIMTMFTGLGQKKSSLSTKSNSEHNMMPFRFSQQIPTNDNRNETLTDVSRADDKDDGKTNINTTAPDVDFKSRFIKSWHINKNRFHSSKGSSKSSKSSKKAPSHNESHFPEDDDGVTNGYIMKEWSFDLAMDEEENDNDKENNDNENDEKDEQMNRGTNL